MVPLQTTPYLRPLQLKHSLVYKHFDINLKVASCSSHGDKMEFFIWKWKIFVGTLKISS